MMHPMADDLSTRLQRAIEEMRPYLERSGAVVRLVGVEDGMARVVVEYGQTGFLLSSLSFVAGIERTLRDKIPGLRGVEPVNMPPYSSVGWDNKAFTTKLVQLDPAKPDAS